MDRSSFDAAEPVLDELAELVDQALDSDQLAAIRDALIRLGVVIAPAFP